MTVKLKNILLTKYVRCEKTRDIFCRICHMRYGTGEAVIRVAGMGVDYHLCPSCAEQFGQALCGMVKESK